MLEIMLPNLVPVQTPPAPAPALVQAPVQTPPAPVQTPAPAKTQRTRVQAPVSDPAPVAVNTPPVVGAPLVAVANAYAVVQAPAGVQQLVGQVQDLVLQQVAVQNVVPEISTAMEVEDEDTMLERLFFKKYGRALPEKEKESDVDQIKFVIDLTDDTDEMETDPTPVLIPVVKTEPIETPEIVANVADVVNVIKVNNNSEVEVAAKQRRASRRLELLELAKARKAITEFGKSLRKKEIIPEKEAPLAAENVIADTDTNMSEDTSVNPVGSVNTIEMAEQVIAESDRRAEKIIAESEFVAEFGDTPIDEFDD
jgi:hypothetical protein